MPSLYQSIAGKRHHRVGLLVGVVTCAAMVAAMSAPASADTVAVTQAATAAVPGVSAATIQSDANRLLTDLAAGRSAVVSPAVLKTLLAEAGTANADLSDAADPQFCTAQTQLVALQKLALADTPASFAAQVDADVLNLQTLILSHSGTQACGGAATGLPAVQAPVAQPVSSDDKQLTLHVVLPAPVFAVKTGAGKQYEEVFEQGFGNAGTAAIGTPELPLTGESVAVPVGASVSVQVLRTTSYQLGNALVWPVQPSGAAAAAPAPGGVTAPGLTTTPLDPPPPFTVKKASYTSDVVTPAKLASAGPVASMRGLRLSTVSLAGASYLPAKQALKVFTSMDVQLTFGGNNTGLFGDSSLTDPWNVPFDNVYQSSVVNWATVARYLGPVVLPQSCGEEMMAITSSLLKPAAQAFAADRTAHGVLTKVFVTDGSGGIGTTSHAIWTAINTAYTNKKCIRPSYVTLLGDTGQLPTFEISLGYHTDSVDPTKQDPNFYEDPVATDMPYGFMHQGFAANLADITDFNQDVLVGRVPAPNLATAMTEVAAITGYDDNPPASSTFYSHVTATAFFQPCPAIQTDCGNSAGNTPVTPSTQDTESFLRTSEFSAQLAAVAGKTVNRVTADESNYDSVPISPATFDNGQPITPGVTFDPSSSDMTSKIQTDIDNGSFLVWHSDHGGGNGVGWYEPPFVEYSNIAGLSDASMLPVVWSSDCDSGKFDAPSYPNVIPDGGTPPFGPYFLESTTAVGFVGASRESPIYNDGYLLQGMGASLFPEEGDILLALFGIAPRAPVVELGALLDAAKNYMVQETGADLATNTGAIGTVLEYNDLGDPSTVVRRDVPTSYQVKLIIAHLAAGKVVLATTQSGLQGGIVTLLRDGKYVGRGVITKGGVTIASATTFTSLQGLTVLLAGDTFRSTTIALAPAATP